MIKKYFWNLFVAVDQLVNTILLGDPDETLSSRMGKMVEQWHKTPANKGRYVISLIICWVLNKIDKGHCKQSIENDEGSNEVIRKD